VVAERIATAVATLVPWSNASRAATWLLAKTVATRSSSATPASGGSGAGVAADGEVRLSR
jgi:hypothetical protein